MAGTATPNIEVRPVRPGDTLRGLSLGDAAFAPLKTFVQKHALNYERQSLARTYRAFDLARNGKLAGHITLVCGEVVTDEGDDVLVAGDGFRSTIVSTLRSRSLGWPSIKDFERLALEEGWSIWRWGSPNSRSRPMSGAASSWWIPRSTP